MEVLLISIVILLIYKIIALIQFKVSKPTSDHGYHIGLINSIRENNHKFVLGHKNYIENKNFMYPQLFHWLLSFIPSDWVKYHYQKIAQAITFLTIVSLLLFAKAIYIDFKIPMNKEYFLFLVGLFFIFTPFNYLLWNAKNRGLSVRGFGLLVAFIFQFALYFYVKTNSLYLLGILCFIALVILLSSQFALQFLLLGIPLYSALFKDLTILIPIIAAPLFFFILMPKVAKSFFVGQFWHKYMFSKLLAPIYFLNRRPSIWRDFIYDFWKKRNLKYILDNAFVCVLLFVPLLPLITIDFFLNEPERQYLFPLYAFVMVPVVVILITSFRFSRFLGEPERYIEFALPFITIIGMVIIPLYFDIALLTLSFLLILLHFAHYGFDAVNANFHQTTHQMKNSIKADSKDSTYINLFSNNIYFLHYFIDEPHFKILMPNITHPNTANIHFKTICPDDYGIINPKALLPLIIHYKINWFILENNRISEKDFLKELNGIKATKILTRENLSLFSITPISS